MLISDIFLLCAAPILAFLGIGWLKRKRMRDDKTRPEQLWQEHALGFAIMIVSLLCLVFGEAGFRDHAFAQRNISEGLYIAISIAAVASWISALVLATRLRLTPAIEGKLAIIAASLLALWLPFFDARFAWSEGILLIGLIAWLGLRLLSKHHTRHAKR